MSHLSYSFKRLSKKIFTTYAQSIWVAIGLTFFQVCRKWENLQDMENPDASLDNRFSWIFTEAFGLFVYDSDEAKLYFLFWATNYHFPSRCLELKLHKAQLLHMIWAEKFLTLPVWRYLVPTPSTKVEGGGVELSPYDLENDTLYKREHSTKNF